MPSELDLRRREPTIGPAPRHGFRPIRRPTQRHRFFQALRDNLLQGLTWGQAARLDKAVHGTNPDDFLARLKGGRREFPVAANTANILGSGASGVGVGGAVAKGVAQTAGRQAIKQALAGGAVGSTQGGLEAQGEGFGPAGTVGAAVLGGVPFSDFWKKYLRTSKRWLPDELRDSQGNVIYDEDNVLDPVTMDFIDSYGKTLDEIEKKGIDPDVKGMTFLSSEGDEQLLRDRIKQAKKEDVFQTDSLYPDIKPERLTPVQKAQEDRFKFLRDEFAGQIEDSKVHSDAGYFTGASSWDVGEPWHERGEKSMSDLFSADAAEQLKQAMKTYDPKTGESTFDVYRYTDDAKYEFDTNQRGVGTNWLFDKESANFWNTEARPVYEAQYADSFVAGGHELDTETLQGKIVTPREFHELAYKVSRPNTYPEGKPIELELHYVDSRWSPDAISENLRDAATILTDEFTGPKAVISKENRKALKELNRVAGVLTYDDQGLPTLIRWGYKVPLSGSTPKRKALEDAFAEKHKRNITRPMSQMMEESRALQKYVEKGMNFMDAYKKATGLKHPSLGGPIIFYE